MCDSKLLTQLKECIVTGLYSRVPNDLKFEEEMATLVKKIYDLNPIDRFTVLKWLTIKWLLENDFTLKINASALSSIEDLSIVVLKERNSFDLKFRELECSCHFNNFCDLREPLYRITLVPGDSDPISIKILKKFMPLFERKANPVAADEFFIRELNLRFSNTIHTRLISPLLRGFPLPSPHTTDGPSLSDFPDIVNANLATTPPPVPLDVQSNFRARSRSPLARAPLTPDVAIDDSVADYR